MEGNGVYAAFAFYEKEGTERVGETGGTRSGDPETPRAVSPHYFLPNPRRSHSVLLSRPPKSEPVGE